MKKMMRMLALILVLGLLCCGCGAPKTPEEVAERMNTALEKTPCSQMDSEVSFNMSMDMGLLGSMDMDMRMVMAMTMCQDPMGAQMDLLMDMSAAGETMQTEAKSYIVMEDGNLVNYTCSEGQWVKTVNAEDVDSMFGSMGSIDLTGATMSIDETITEFEGVKVICLNVAMTGEGVEDVLGGVMQDNEAMNILGDVDWSALSCEGKLYVDAKTYLPVAEIMSISGLDTAMSSAFEGLGVTVEIGTFDVSVRFRSYEPVDPIVVPEEAADAVDITGSAAA